ncbi:MAG TPA: iron donor protein CyaY [Burkholderiaceae bacterium]|nr:iron donor protein CyaY [Burkholderiaceae bacterium]
MTESEFLERAEAALAGIEDAVDASGLDIELSRAGNVLTLELSDGGRVVVNSQLPMRQLWLAARSGAHHYQWSDGSWRDTRDGTEFFSALSRIVSALSGSAVVFSGRPR